MEPNRAGILSKASLCTNKAKNGGTVKKIETIWTFMPHMLENFLGTAVELEDQRDF